MAFFGLTALGLQNPVAVSSDTIIHFPIFTDEDFRRGFEKQKRQASFDGLSITRAQVCLRRKGRRLIHRESCSTPPEPDTKRGRDAGSRKRLSS